MKILLATGNMGKLREMESVFRSANMHDVEILTLNDLPHVEEPIEDGNTFLANAYIKVKYYYDIFKIPTISDDTGLLVEALNGAPGVLSARYGSINGEHTDPYKNNLRILKELENKINRNAKFITAMYYYDGVNLISSVGELRGVITHAPRGDKSFGYSYIFEIPEYKQTLAEISDELRYAINHRGKASRMLIEQIKGYIVKK
jgi:XTP/dITP diphosphohydrolase